MASSPLLKWLFGRRSRSSPTVGSINPPTPALESFGPPQSQTSWTEMDPPRVAGFQFVPSPAASPGNSYNPNYPAIDFQDQIMNTAPPWAAGPTVVEVDQGELPNIASQLTPQASCPTGNVSTRPQSTHSTSLRRPGPRPLTYMNPGAPSSSVIPPVDVQALHVQTPTKETRKKLRLPKRSQLAQGSDDDDDDSDKSDAEEDEPCANTDKPTCSLNLVCYRQGVAGCKIHQIHVTKASRFEEPQEYTTALKKNPALITSDTAFFGALRDGYVQSHLLNPSKYSASNTSSQYAENSRPTVVPLNDFVLQEILHAYNHPSEIDTDHVWIDWVFNLRQRDKRHALEFVEGWNGTRIAILGMIPLVLSTLVGLIWSIQSGDWQTAFTVAGFILTAGTLLLALLAVVSGIETLERASTI